MIKMLTDAMYLHGEGELMAKNDHSGSISSRSYSHSVSVKLLLDLVMG